MSTRKKAVVNIPGRIQKIETIKLAHHGVIEDIVESHGIGWIFRRNLFKSALRLRVVEHVKIIQGRLDFWSQVETIGMGAIRSSRDGGMRGHQGETEPDRECPDSEQISDTFDPNGIFRKQNFS